MLLIKPNTLFRTINSPDRLSIYGALADRCEKVTQQIRGRYGEIHPFRKNDEQLDCPLASEDVKTNRLRDHKEIMENMWKEVKVTQTCEIATSRFSWVILPSSLRH